MLESLQKAEQRIVRSEANYRGSHESASGVPYRLNFQTSQYEFIGAGIERLVEIPLDEFSSGRLQEMVVETQMIDSRGPTDVKELCAKFRRV